MMPQFRRGLPELALERLQQTAQEHAWFGGLLRRWRPSGHPLDEGGVSGLRLAIRDNYLNFYRYGQSVARVSFDRDSNPRADVHNKYVYGTKGAGQSYVRVQDGSFPAALGSDALVPYDPDRLTAWIAASENHNGAEKRFVEAVVAASPNVVDLEMGLPAFSNEQDKRVAPRMDLVAIEYSEMLNASQIVFWEAKGAGDSRARCRGETPEVVEQLRTYETWLGYGEHKRIVVDAYVTVCRLLVRLREVAVAVGAPDLPLAWEVTGVAERGFNVYVDAAMKGAACDRVGVDLKPRLLIDNHYAQASASFESNGHLDKLTSEPHKLLVHVVRSPNDLRLPSFTELKETGSVNRLSAFVAQQTGGA